MNTPKLRFKNFNDKWTLKKIKDIANVLNGYAFSSTEFKNSGIPVITISSINNNKIDTELNCKFVDESNYEKYKNYTIGKNATVMTLTGSHYSQENSAVGKVALNNFESELLLNQRLAAISPIKDISNPYFIFYFFSRKTVRKDLSKKSIGSANQANISSSDLINCKVSIPSLLEQGQIGIFFKKVDYRIKLQQEKIDLLKEQKKGYMQKIFSLEIRFKDKNGRDYPEWSQHKLSKFTERVTRKNSDLLTKRPLTISAQHGLIDQVEFFNKTVASKNLTGYYLLNQGEFAYNKSYSNGYPLGAIKRLDNYDNGALSTLYICFKPKGSVNSDFLVHYFNSTQWYKEVSLISVEGARNHGLLNVSVSDFFDTLHYLPCLEEQSKISKFLDCFTRKIKLNEQKLKNLQSQKQAYMQQMFI